MQMVGSLFSQLLQSTKNKKKKHTKMLVGPRKTWKKQSWEASYRELAAYKNRHGHCNVPHSDLPRLGNWVSIQKGRNRTKLRPDQVDCLNAIGFNWDRAGTRFDQKWDESLALLKAYKAEHGSTIISSTTSIGADHTTVSLKHWTAKQRTAYHNKTLRGDRLKKLEGVGFAWVADASKQWSRDRDVSRLERQWQDMYEKLVVYREACNTCLAPCRNEAKNKQLNNQNQGEYKQLGRWVRAQRTSFLEGRLAPKRQQQLNAIAFVWKVNTQDAERSLHQKQWNGHFARLVQFKKQHGHTRVPRGYSNDEQLANWVRVQRRFLRNNTLSPARAQRLAFIDFWLGRTNEKEPSSGPDKHIHHH